MHIIDIAPPPRARRSVRSRQTKGHWRRFFVGALMVLMLLVALAYALASWYVGKQIEAQWRYGHNQLTQTWGTPVELLEYRRGWFHSEARTIMALPGSSASLDWQHAIAHGPLLGFFKPALARIVSQGSLTAGATLGAAATTGVPSVATVQTQVGFSGDTSIEVEARSAVWHNQAGAEVRLRPGTVQLQFDAAVQRVRTQVDWKGLEIRQGNQLVGQLLDVKGSDQYERKLGTQHVYVGASEYVMGRLLIKDRPEMTVDGIGRDLLIESGKLNFNASTRDTWLDAVLRVDAPTLTWQGSGLGPAHTAVSLREIDLNEWDELLPSVLGLASMGSPATAWSSLTPAQQEALRTHVAAVVSGGLSLQLDELYFMLPDGLARLDAKAQAPGLVATDLLFMPMSLWSKLHVTVNIEAPEASAAQWQGQEGVWALADQGLVTLEDGQVKTLLEYQGGMTTINGHPFDPRGFEQLLY